MKTIGQKVFIDALAGTLIAQEKPHSSKLAVGALHPNNYSMSGAWHYVALSFQTAFYPQAPLNKGLSSPYGPWMEAFRLLAAISLSSLGRNFPG